MIPLDAFESARALFAAIDISAQKRDHAAISARIDELRRHLERARAKRAELFQAVARPTNELRRQSAAAAAFIVGDDIGEAIDDEGRLRSQIAELNLAIRGIEDDIAELKAERRAIIRPSADPLVEAATPLAEGAKVAIGSIAGQLAQLYVDLNVVGCATDNLRAVQDAERLAVHVAMFHSSGDLPLPLPEPSAECRAMLETASEAIEFRGRRIPDRAPIPTPPLDYRRGVLVGLAGSMEDEAA